MTRRKQQIEAIAVQIAELDLTSDEVAEHNAAGWEINIRYSDAEYISDTSYTRTTDIHLSAEEVETAIALADEFSGGADLVRLNFLADAAARGHRHVPGDGPTWSEGTTLTNRCGECRLTIERRPGTDWVRAWMPPRDLADWAANRTVRGPGRPEVGAVINVRLGDELLAAVDAHAQSADASRAATIRTLLTSALAQHPCEFRVESGVCGRPGVVVRSLTGERPYGLCAEHAIEDASILGLDEDTLANTDEPITR